MRATIIRSRTRLVTQGLSLPIVSVVVPFSGLTNCVFGSHKVTPERNYNGDYMEGTRSC